MLEIYIVLTKADYWSCMLLGREVPMWWLGHLWVIAIQILAFVPYAIGSRAFYKHEKHFRRWLAAGIVMDIFMAITASTGILPRMSPGQGAPWASAFFLTHIVLSGGGMFAFVLLFAYLLVRGTDRNYPRLRWVQYRVFLTAWMIGVSIALVNFVVKVAYGQRIYDLPWQMLR